MVYPQDGSNGDELAPLPDVQRRGLFRRYALIGYPVR